MLVSTLAGSYIHLAAKLKIGVQLALCLQRKVVPTKGVPGGLILLLHDSWER